MQSVLIRHCARTFFVHRFAILVIKFTPPVIIPTLNLNLKLYCCCSISDKNNLYNSNPNNNNTETTESTPPTEVTKILLLISCTLIPDNITPLQVLTKNVRKVFVTRTDTNTSEKTASKTNETFDQFQFQNTTTLPFAQFNRTVMKRLMYNPYTDYMIQFLNVPPN